MIVGLILTCNHMTSFCILIGQKWHYINAKAFIQCLKVHKHIQVWVKNNLWIISSVEISSLNTKRRNPFAHMCLQLLCNCSLPVPACVCVCAWQCVCGVAQPCDVTDCPRSLRVVQLSAVQADGVRPDSREQSSPSNQSSDPCFIYQTWISTRCSTRRLFSSRTSRSSRYVAEPTAEANARLANGGAPR